MKVYLFRHAQKVADFSGDPNLTTQGFLQAERLAAFVAEKRLPTPTQLYSSPRIRAQNTFKALANQARLEIQIDDRLLEQDSNESTQVFWDKIRSFFESLEYQKNEIIYVCSHYDVVAEALQLLPSDTDFSDSLYSQWAPCQYAGFDVSADGLYHFLEFNRVPL